MNPRPVSALVMGIIALLFGGLTLFSGGTNLFGGGDAGNYVGFVLWFNFLAGFAYILAGIGLILWQHWAIPLAGGIAAATVLVFIAFGIHIAMGGLYETKTLGAMVLRSGVWIAIAWLSRKAWNRISTPNP